jgi:YHS domain-containing protein
LVLQHNKKATDLFNQDKAGNIVKADKNWPSLVIRNGTGGKTLVQTDKRGVALEGYDPIAYFTDGKPQKGDANIEATYNGALYHFTSQAHREMFEKAPSKYAPAYGGYCGYAASIGRCVRRPAAVVHRRWPAHRAAHQGRGGALDKDVKGNKAKADKFWPKLVEVKGGQKDPVDSLWGSSVLAEARNQITNTQTPKLI